jgi:hypothetical protein
MARFLKSVAICAAVCSLAAVFGVTSANAAPKQGLQKGYLGAAVGTSGGDGALGITGRISFGDTPISIRLTSYFVDGISVGTSAVTYDFGVAEKTNIYAGIGATGASDGTTSVSGGGILQAGVEREISKNVVLFGDGSFGDGYSIFKVGVGYSL